MNLESTAGLMMAYHVLITLNINLNAGHQIITIVSAILLALVTANMQQVMITLKEDFVLLRMDLLASKIMVNYAITATIYRVALLIIEPKILVGHTMD